MTDRLSYTAITPARNEAENVRRLAAALAQQRVQPSRWLIVDDGSTDDTPVVVAELVAKLDWVRSVQTHATGAPRPGAPVVRAFHAGLAALDLDADLVVKLDADVSFDDDYFALVLDAFAADPRLGIASGGCLEQNDGDGAWQEVPGTPGHARGACRVYRRACLEQVLPLPECMGWDGVDELKARVLGWRTGQLEGVAFRHHRPEGARDGHRFSRWCAQGEGAYFMGYRPTYLVLRACYRARRDPAALAMVWGFMRSAARRRPRYEDDAVRRELRRSQGFRQLATRNRAASLR